MMHGAPGSRDAALLVLLVLVAGACGGVERDGAAGSAAPARERTIDFAGMPWTVKRSDVPIGPGPNLWSSSADSVWVDEAGRLHLTMRPHPAGWTSAEVVGPVMPVHPRVEVTIASPVDSLDPSVIAGIFLYEHDDSEVDVEFGRWGDAAAPGALFAVHGPGDRTRTERFACVHTRPTTRVLIDWTPHHIDFRATNCSSDDRTWRIDGDVLPRSGRQRLHINLWAFDGGPTATGAAPELVITGVSVSGR